MASSSSSSGIQQPSVELVSITELPESEVFMVEDECSAPEERSTIIKPKRVLIAEHANKEHSPRPHQIETRIQISPPTPTTHLQPHHHHLQPHHQGELESEELEEEEYDEEEEERRRHHEEHLKNISQHLHPYNDNASEYDRAMMTRSISAYSTDELPFIEYFENTTTPPTTPLYSPFSQGNEHSALLPSDRQTLVRKLTSTKLHHLKKSNMRKSMSNLSLNLEAAIAQSKVTGWVPVVKKFTSKIMWKACGWCLPPHKRKYNKQSTNKSTEATIEDPSPLPEGDTVNPQFYYEKLDAQQKTDFKLFLMDLGYALALYGASTHRIEYHLTLVAAYFGLDGSSFFVTPTGLFFSFGDRDTNFSENQTNFVRISGTSLDLHKLCAVDDIADELVRGKLPLQQARKKIREVVAMPALNPYVQFVMLILNAGCCSILLQGSWVEICASFLAGLAVAILTLIGRKVPVVAKAHQILSAFSACAIGVLAKVVILNLAVYFPGVIDQRINVFLIALSGVIALLPGLTFTVAISELANWHLVSGTARLLAGVMPTLQIGFGLLVGGQLSSMISYPPESSKVAEIPIIVILVTISINAIIYMVNLRVPRYPLVLFTTFLASLTGFFFSKGLPRLMGEKGEQFGSLLGGFFVGIFGHIYSRISSHPANIVITCSLLTLVPGSMGLRGINSFLEHDITAGVEFLFRLFMSALALAVGLIISSHLIPPSKKLRISHVDL